MKLLLAAALLLAPVAQAKTETWNVNTADSKISWEGRKKIGDAHTGELALKTGKVIMNGGKLTGGEFEIDMQSLKVTDIKDEGMNAKLVGHLKSDDFFSVDKFPVATLKITKVAAGKDGKQNISGSLTIKGKTHPISFPAEVHPGKDSVHAVANFNVDRTKYDVRYNSMKFFSSLGDKVINDEFSVKVDLTAKK